MLRLRVFGHPGLHHTRKLGSNVQKLGVCCPILSPHTIRTVPGQTNRHGQEVIPAINPTSIIHGQNKKI